MTLRHHPTRTVGAALPEPPTRTLAEIQRDLQKLDARQSRMLRVLLRTEDRALKRIEAENSRRWREMLLPIGLSVAGSLIAAYLVGHFRGLRHAIKEGSEDIR